MVDPRPQAPDPISQAIEAALAAARDALGQGRVAEAEAAYGKALNLAGDANRQVPENPRWLYYTGIAMSDMGHPLKAMDALSMALTYDGEFPEARNLLDRVMSKTITDRLRELRAEAGSAVEDETGEPPRSVLFFNNLYYNFATLSAALRRRGWDALTVSFEDPDGHDSFIYYGEDLNLYQDVHPALMEKVRSLIDRVPEHFRLFYTMGRWLDHYPTVWCDDDSAVLKVKRHGVKFGWNPCGCLEVIRQSQYFEWSGGACLKCNWRTRPDVCSDAVTQEFAGRITANADLIAAEDLPAIDFAAGPNCVHRPLIAAIDSQVWRPDLEVPEDLRVPRADGEFLVYHAVGNAPVRSVEASNVKGTAAVHAALGRLNDEGIPVKLIPVPPNTHNLTVRFLMVQADVVVDQLNLGTTGATTREALMLGKPTICRLIDERPRGAPVSFTASSPIVRADEATIDDVLKDLLLSPDKRADLGRQSRTFALKWWDGEACAERFEAAYDRMMAGEVLNPGAGE